MNIRTNTHGIELTPSISSYIEKKLITIERLLSNTPPETYIEVEIEKDTKLRKGQGFKAEINVYLPNKQVYASAQDDDLYAAIDDAKDEILSELKKQSTKKRDIARRSAARVKMFVQQVGTYLTPFSPRRFIPRKKSK